MPAAVETFNRNHGQDIALRADLVALGPAGVVAGIEARGFRPVGVLGGPPCQGFSRGNVERSKPSDARNELPLLYAQIVARLAEHFGLHFFIFENVPGLLRTRHSARLDAMRSMLSSVFSILEVEVDAYDYGVPQHRPRLLWIGLRSDTIGHLPWPPAPSLSGPRTVKEAFGLLPEPTFWERNGKDNAAHPNHWTMKPKSKRFETGTFNRWRSFRRLEWNEPSPTVAYGNREIHIHPNGQRRLSIFEAMLLQGFPRSYILTGNLSEQVTQVCNAVPPMLAFSFATRIRALFAAAEHQ